jgi:hypothetical protein
VNPADAQLIEQIRQVTQGGCRLLVTLARRGKALEQDEPERAASLLAAVGTHPLYKGGRLAFDMLEIEDLMLEDSSVDPMSTHELIQVLNAGAYHLVERLMEMGYPAQGGRMPAEASVRDTDALGVPVRDSNQSVDEPVSASLLPRVSLGLAEDVPRTANASAARDEGRDTREIEPQLQSSDYLYDYVVLGLLDRVASIRMFPSKAE